MRVLIFSILSGSLVSIFSRYASSKPVLLLNSVTNALPSVFLKLMVPSAAFLKVSKNCAYSFFAKGACGMFGYIGHAHHHLQYICFGLVYFVGKLFQLFVVSLCKHLVYLGRGLLAFLYSTLTDTSTLPRSNNLASSLRSSISFSRYMLGMRKEASQSFTVKRAYFYGNGFVFKIYRGFSVARHGLQHIMFFAKVYLLSFVLTQKKQKVKTA